MGESLMASLGRSMGSECVSACDSVNALLVEETDIVSTSVKVFCWFVTTQSVRLVGGTYTSFSEGKAKWKRSFSQR